MTSWQFLALFTSKSIPRLVLSQCCHWYLLSQQDGNIVPEWLSILCPAWAADLATDRLTPDLGGIEGNGFQPANTVGGGGMVWEGRLLQFAPVSYICGALHAMPAVPGVEINSVSWCFKSRTMKRVAGTVERHYSAWPSICFYYESCCFNSFSENPMPLESGDCNKISNLLPKFT